MAEKTESESPRPPAESEQKMPPSTIADVKLPISGLPPTSAAALLGWPPLFLPWAPLLPGAWCSSALRNALPG